MATERKVPAKTIEARMKKLTELGFVPDGDTQLRNGKLIIEKINIEYSNAETWKETIEQLEKHLAEGTHDIPFVEAETLSQNDAGAAATFELVVKDEFEKELVTIDINKQRIAEAKEQFGNLTISGLDDVKGFEAVAAAKKAVAAMRIKLEKKTEAIKAPLIAKNKAISALSKDYMVLIAEIEDPLKKQLEDYDQLKQADDKRKEEEAEAQTKQRIKLLSDAGMIFNGVWYAIGENITMDIVTIKGMSDTEFEFLLEKVKAEKIKLDREALLIRKNARIQQVIDIGMVLNENQTAYIFVNEFANLRLPIDDLVDPDDSVFNNGLYDLREAIKAAKQKVEDKAAEERKKFEDDKAELRRERIQLRQSKCELAGLLLNPVAMSYDFKNKYTEVSITGSFIEEADNDTFNAKIAEISSMVTIAKNNEAVAAKKEAEDRQRKIDEDARIEKLWRSRLAELNGVTWNGHEATIFYQEEKIIATYEQLISFSDSEFVELRDASNKIYADFMAEKQRKLQEEQDAANQKNERYQARKTDLSVMGVFLMDEGFCFPINASSWKIWKTKDEVNEIATDDWDEEIEALICKMEQAQEEEKNRLQVIEEERQKLMPEIDKVIAYVDAMSAVKVPQITDPKLIEILSHFAFHYSEATNKLRRDIDTLSK